MLKVISISILNTHELVETAALKQGIRNPETETETKTESWKRKRNTESVKEGSKRSI